MTDKQLIEKWKNERDSFIRSITKEDIERLGDKSLHDLVDKKAKKIGFDCILGEYSKGNWLIELDEYNYEVTRGRKTHQLTFEYSDGEELSDYMEFDLHESTCPVILDRMLTIFFEEFQRRIEERSKWE